MTITKYTRDILEVAVAKSIDWGEVTRSIGAYDCGGNRDYIKHKCIRYGIDYSHFRKRGGVIGLHPKGHPNNKKKRPEEVLVMRPDGSLRLEAYKLRRALTESGIEEKCAECGVGKEWNGKPLRIEVDHIDGNHLNCTIDNLRFLCPNCHSQTPTFRRYDRINQVRPV